MQVARIDWVDCYGYLNPLIEPDKYLNIKWLTNLLHLIYLFRRTCILFCQLNIWMSIGKIEIVINSTFQIPGWQKLWHTKSDIFAHAFPSIIHEYYTKLKEYFPKSYLRKIFNFQLGFLFIYAFKFGNRYAFCKIKYIPQC